MLLSRFSTTHVGVALAALVFGGLLALPVHAQSSDSTGTITVRVGGLDSNNGTVRAELTTRENYNEDGNIRAASLSIQNTSAEWTIEEVPSGTYAVRLYHDANGNGELDTNMFGVPQEPFGFSNNVRGTMGPPSFEKAAFSVEDETRSMTITVK